MQIVYLEVWFIQKEQLLAGRFVLVVNGYHNDLISSIREGVQNSVSEEQLSQVEPKLRGGPPPLDTSWTMVSALLHDEQQALERSDETKGTYPFTLVQVQGGPGSDQG